ncbi:MAG: FAD-dependent monooxygenase [Gammaproteobacteria bacterium]
MNNFDYDILIIGGGVIGLTLACALRNAPLKIALVSGHHTADRRVSAINRASQHIFESLGIWKAIGAQGISPYQAMQVWEAEGRPPLDFNCVEVGEPNLGYIIENQAILSALKGAIDTSPIKCYTELNWQNLSAHLIVGADGARSHVRAWADIEIAQHDYDHHALVTTVQTELPHQRTARQIFLSTGPLAFLPLVDPHQCSIVWSSSPEHIQQLVHRAPDEFKVALEQAFEYKLGQLTLLTDRLSFPLRMQHAQQYVKKGVALIGDAAHTLHPLAGQGMNLGLLDAACLAEVLFNAVGKNRDIGSLSTLRRYERWRKGHNSAMLMAMDGFLKPLLRKTGLQIAANIPAIKRAFMRHAVGLAGDLPELAQLSTR